LWAIWRSRNERVFNNKEAVIGDIIDRVKFQSWNWFIGRVAKFPCLLYEWNWSPIDCFMRWSAWLALVLLRMGLCCVASGLACWSCCLCRGREVLALCLFLSLC
jgi:hypothetical protein